MELGGPNWKYSGGGGVLTVHQSVEDELAVLLHQVVDVAENATVGRGARQLTAYCDANCLCGCRRSDPLFSWQKLDGGEGEDAGKLSGERGAELGETYHMLIQRNRRP